MNTNTNPWIGLDSYREGQILYGRSREIRDLSMAVFHNRQTVVYGRSGIGKSSLLHAGIFPEARLRGCLPVSVRFNHSCETGYSDQLFRVISDAVTAYGGVMTDTVEDGGAIRSLWEFFHRFRPEKDGKPLTPLIVVDQFEEIFTLSKRAEQVRAFFDELADLLNDVMPDYLQSAVQQTTAAASGSSMFDGLNFHLPDNRYMHDANFHLVLALREDYLSYLERFASRIPALKQNRYGLLPITYTEAMEIITQPRPGLVSEEVADTIIRQVVTEEDINPDTPVDSAILSLFLSRLYEKKGDAPAINRQLVEEQGDALLEDFYAEIVAPLDKKTVWYLEDTLINADGHRENVTLESLYKNDWLSRPTVETLEKSHLLRLFSYGDVQRLEFAHDVLCPIIVRRRTQRVNEENHKKSRRRAIWAYFGFFIVVFMSIYAYENYSYRERMIKDREKKLSEIEASLILKGAQKMLDEHDIYGTIHLLLNSMEMDYYSRDQAFFISTPSETTANMERYLRKAVDSLQLSKEPCVAKLHYTATEPVIMTLSPSGRLVAIPDYSDRNFVVDSRTGAIVQAIAPHYPVELFTYHPISTRNAQQWRWVVRDGRIQFGMQNHDYTQRLTITDIHPDDSRCLIIGHNAVYECFIRAFDWHDNGHTRLCLHDFPKGKKMETCVTDATYNEDGNLIAIQLQYDSIGTDSIVICELYHYYLYDSNTGEIIQNDTSSAYAQCLIDNVEKRRGEVDPDYIDLDGNWKGTKLEVTSYSKFLYQGRQIYLSVDRVETDTNSAIAPVFIPSQEQERSMRAHLDTLSSLPFVDYIRSFYYDETDTIWYVGDEKRYNWPLAISPDQKRVVLMRPMSAWDENIYTLYGVYPHNGAVFFYKNLPIEVRTIQFTEDDQYVIVNAGDADEQAIYLPPLPELVNKCIGIFFDWQMSSDDRYQTYLHMND